MHVLSGSEQGPCSPRGRRAGVRACARSGLRPSCRARERRRWAVAAHARYVSDRIGVAHVALGSDFDGATIPNA
ncbi:MAG: hypothetical protein E6G34_10190 [Actinobacteria bacterium]|nr:MAG: hypothetical protein E6G34_10190 [Actinomycetota bacterium]